MDLSVQDAFRHDDFETRHIGPDADQITTMLDAIGVGSLSELIDQAVPSSIRVSTPLDLPDPGGVDRVLAELADLASRNQVFTNLIGMGYVGTTTPPVIQRNVLENPAWYTSYTPYQAEISQGRLEATLNFQTAVADLCGLDIANASLLDEATAAAEAMTVARRASKATGDRFFVHADVFPQTLAVLRTRAEPLGIELVIGETEDLFSDDTPLFGALLSYPTGTGGVYDLTTVVDRVHALGGLAIAATDLGACVLLRTPGSMGVDVAVGSAQRFGVPLGFGGPHAAFIAVREEFARQLPGRLVGVSTDSAGRPALRLALQTREQHIRRERATSNICTAQALLANMAGMYACWHGPEGLRRISTRIHLLACLLAHGVRSAGAELKHDAWFDTVCVTGVDADEVIAAAARNTINLRRVDETTVGVTFDETTTLDILNRVLAAFGAETIDSAGLDSAGVNSGGVNSGAVDSSGTPLVASPIQDGMLRERALLPQAVFSRYRSEHDMLRYLRRLADRDLALDRTMIPLGSCTMKLNATAEMIPITWPEFAHIHPFAPAEQSSGYRTMIEQLESYLAEITGYDAVSVQPNAGSQGEFAGLLAIRAYHRSNGDDDRTVCLIPSSAHGTNAASAVMAGMDVVVVACTDTGDVDLDDLDAKIASVGNRLACIMVTYPSTHGVFEQHIVELCERVHAAGGQVYVDGANMNALVGLARPGSFGADVSHLNLHKTFCIPHGGGGPGVGPVAVRSHLAKFLPGSALDPQPGPVGAVSAAPFGSASILPISWVYIRLMGATGLTAATEAAICSANYLAARLSERYPILYTGADGRVAHECIVDVRAITKQTGVTVEDIAKRLIDFGFHAPTVSFPVAGTLMIEPTESESLVELDRFCSAMFAIRDEIEQIAAGAVGLDSSALRLAPHTASDLLGDWDRDYSRAAAAQNTTDKYFPPVSRIDNAGGDRNLICDCAPLEAYAEQAGASPALT